MSSKVLIIGLDGGTWKIFKPLMEEGKMPALGKMFEEGASGVLRSTIPPITAAAWASFQTGVNPGKHGIIDFQSFDPKTKRTQLVNSGHLKLDTIWKLASRHNKKIISINVPLTYPPREVNGVVIGGMLSPKVDRNFVRPPDVYERFIKDHDYKITAGRLEKRASMKLQDFINNQIKAEQIRFKVAQQLMEEYEWDLFMVHNQLMDGIQHAFYPYLDPQSGSYDREKHKKISEFYRMSDRFIRELIEQAGDNTTVILLSDHGHREVSTYVNLNAWLREKGYLALTYKRFLGKMLSGLRKLDVINLEKKILGKLVKSPTLIAELSRKASSNLINWEKTEAFMINGGMWGNLHCKDEKTINKITQELQSFKGPVNNLNVVKNIYRKEEIFSGSYLGQLPDLFLSPNEGYAFHAPLIKDIKPFHRADITRYDRVGIHDQNGVLVLQGQNVKIHKNMQADIVDLAPTIFALLDIPIPKYMDGKVLEEVFVEKPEVKIEERELSAITRSAKYSEEDKKEIEERLQDLGYL